MAVRAAALDHGVDRVVRKSPRVQRLQRDRRVDGGGMDGRTRRLARPWPRRLMPATRRHASRRSRESRSPAPRAAGWPVQRADQGEAGGASGDRPRATRLTAASRSPSTSSRALISSSANPSTTRAGSCASAATASRLASAVPCPSRRGDRRGPGSARRFARRCSSRRR